MEETVRIGRRRAAAAPSASVAVWLLAELGETGAGGVAQVRVDSVLDDLVLLRVTAGPRAAAVVDRIGTLLSEPRFAGWVLERRVMNAKDIRQ